MLKTNSKQARANVRTFIVDNSRIDTENGERKAQDFTEAAQAIASAFYRAEIENANYIYGGTLQSAFENYTQGLPHALNCDFYLCKAVDTLGDILEETQEERAKYSEEKAGKTLVYLIFSELSKVANMRTGKLYA